MTFVDVVTTPIHRRIKLEADGTRRERVYVRCPRGAEWEPIEGCRRCGSCAHLSMPDRTDDWLLICNAPSSKKTRGNSTTAERTPITDAMESSVLCAVRDLPIATLATAMRDGDFEIAVVVDADDRPIGIVAPIDLAGARGATAAAVMTPFATTLLEDAPIARALAFAVEGELMHIPILSAGRVMGLASPRSLLEWLTTPR
jgi:CBS domain-containing protein